LDYDRVVAAVQLCAAFLLDIAVGGIATSLVKALRRTTGVIVAAGALEPVVAYT
jgi:hypothetical protein